MTSRQDDLFDMILKILIGLFFMFLMSLLVFAHLWEESGEVVCIEDMNTGEPYCWNTTEMIS